MARNINPLDSWLRSGPGVIFGRDEADAVENAFAVYLADGGRLEYFEFVAALREAGYLPAQQYRTHGEGGGADFVSRIQLPQPQPDHDPRADFIERPRRREDDAKAARSMKWTHAEPGEA